MEIIAIKSEKSKSKLYFFIQVSLILLVTKAENQTQNITEMSLQVNNPSVKSQFFSQSKHEHFLPQMKTCLIKSFFVSLVFGKVSGSNISCIINLKDAAREIWNIEKNMNININTIFNEFYTRNKNSLNYFQKYQITWNSHYSKANLYNVKHLENRPIYVNAEQHFVEKGDRN